MYLFKLYFCISRDDSSIPYKKEARKSKFYTWADSQYASFMMKVMQNLEPRKFYKDELILFDLEEVDEVLFVCSGSYGVGY